jgi:hypothetical protein
MYWYETAAWDVAGATPQAATTAARHEANILDRVVIIISPVSWPPGGRAVDLIIVMSSVMGRDIGSRHFSFVTVARIRAWLNTDAR